MAFKRTEARPTTIPELERTSTGLFRARLQPVTEYLSGIDSNADTAMSNRIVSLMKRDWTIARATFRVSERTIRRRRKAPSRRVTGAPGNSTRPPCREGAGDPPPSAGSVALRVEALRGLQRAEGGEAQDRPIHGTAAGVAHSREHRRQLQPAHVGDSDGVGRRRSENGPARDLVREVAGL